MSFGLKVSRVVPCPKVFAAIRSLKIFFYAPQGIGRFEDALAPELILMIGNNALKMLDCKSVRNRGAMAWYNLKQRMNKELKKG